MDQTTANGSNNSKARQGERKMLHLQGIVRENAEEPAQDAPSSGKTKTKTIRGQLRPAKKIISIFALTVKKASGP
jgi:hypothetical protein